MTDVTKFDPRAFLERGECPPEMGARPITFKRLGVYVSFIYRGIRELADGIGRVSDRVDARLDKHSRRANRIESRLKGVERRYLGVWKADRGYMQGDAVTSGGSLFICQMNETTLVPGKSDAWQLAVKRGGDGRDGARGPIGPMPAHQWLDQTKLRFQQPTPDGGVKWGEAVQLKGEPGPAGRSFPVPMGGGGGQATAAPAKSYWPQGW